MDVTTSSFTIAITPCNIPYTDDKYRVIASSYSVPRRYIEGGYIPFSNEFVFDYFPPGLSNGVAYNTLTSLTPDINYYYTIELKNKVEDNYTEIYNGLVTSDFITTMLPDEAMPDEGATFISILDISGNSYPTRGIPVTQVSSNRVGPQIEIINGTIINSLDFLLSDILPIHTSNNTGSIASNIVTNKVYYLRHSNIQIDDITQSIGGYPIIESNYTVQGTYTQLCISNISDYYEGVSNFRGFYLKFSTIVSLQGAGLGGDPFSKEIIYQRNSSDYTYSNRTQKIYVDDLISAPVFSLDLPTFYALSNNTSYVCGILCTNRILISDVLQITNLYRNFITPDVLGISFHYRLYNLDINGGETISDISSFTCQNAALYTLQGELINISNTYPLPSNIQIQHFSTILGNSLFSPFLVNNPDYNTLNDLTFNFYAQNIYGTTNTGYHQLREFYDINISNSSLYWDNPSIIVRDATSCNTSIYGQRMINYQRFSGFNPGIDYSYGPLPINPSDHLGRTEEEFGILLMGVPFDHTSNLVPSFPRDYTYGPSPYEFEIQLSHGDFIGPRYAQSLSNTPYIDISGVLPPGFYPSSNGPPIGYLNYSCNFSPVQLASGIYTYPDYSTETIDPYLVYPPVGPPYPVGATSIWRWVTFSYFFSANSVNTESGACMLKILGNNFQMDPVTKQLYTIPSPLGPSYNTYQGKDIQIYYKTYCPSESIIRSNMDFNTDTFNFNTCWMDAQNVVTFGTANFGFIGSNTYNSGLYSSIFIQSNIEYSNSTQNRIIAIPPAVQTQDFYLLVTLGFYYKSQGAFQYIEPVFQS